MCESFSSDFRMFFFLFFFIDALVLFCCCCFFFLFHLPEETPRSEPGPADADDVGAGAGGRAISGDFFF